MGCRSTSRKPLPMVRRGFALSSKAISVLIAVPISSTSLTTSVRRSLYISRARNARPKDAKTACCRCTATSRNSANAAKASRAAAVPSTSRSRAGEDYQPHVATLHFEHRRPQRLPLAETSFFARDQRKKARVHDALAQLLRPAKRWNHRSESILRRRPSRSRPRDDRWHGRPQAATVFFSKSLMMQGL